MDEFRRSLEFENGMGIHDNDHSTKYFSGCT